MRHINFIYFILLIYFATSFINTNLVFLVGALILIVTPFLFKGLPKAKTRDTIAKKYSFSFNLML